MVHADDAASVVAFTRSREEETLLVVLNRSEVKQTVVIPRASVPEWKGSKACVIFASSGKSLSPLVMDAALRVDVPALSGVIVRPGDCPKERG